MVSVNNKPLHSASPKNVAIALQKIGRPLQPSLSLLKLNSALGTQLGTYRSDPVSASEWRYLGIYKCGRQYTGFRLFFTPIPVASKRRRKMIEGRKSFHYSPVQHGFNLVRLTLNISTGFQPLLVSTGAVDPRQKGQPARIGWSKWHNHTPLP